MKRTKKMEADYQRTLRIDSRLKEIGKHPDAPHPEFEVFYRPPCRKSPSCTLRFSFFFQYLAFWECEIREILAKDEEAHRLYKEHYVEQCLYENRLMPRHAVSLSLSPSTLHLKKGNHRQVYGGRTEVHCHYLDVEHRKGSIHYDDVFFD